MTDTPKPMTKADRTELRRITKTRFQLLRTELRQRQYSVQEEITEKIRDEHSAAMKKHSAKATKWADKYTKLMDEFKELQTAAREDGVSLFHQNHSHGTHVVSAPLNLNQLVHSAQTRVNAQVNQAQLVLDKQQLELEEELAIGALESDKAREFMGKIPSVETLLPASSVDKAIEASIVEVQ